MQKRRGLLLDLLNNQFEIKVNSPASSLYIFIPLSALGIERISSEEFCRRVLQEANIALIPGAAFGCEGYIRLSFGADASDLKLGVRKLSAYLKSSSWIR